METTRLMKMIPAQLLCGETVMGDGDAETRRADKIVGRGSCE
jgi:ribosome-associated protein YbcJ (S4-like RNA binding protein)